MLFRKSHYIVIVLLLFFSILSSRLDAAPKDDEVIYKDRKNFQGRDTTLLSLDFSGIKHPRVVDEYNPLFHFPSIRQDTTGTCWCFSTTSFLETEINRLYGKKIALSRLFTVYWEYVEKVRRFVREKGNSLVDQGSEQNAVLERIRQYGAIRAEDYTGLVNGKTVHNHKPLLKEIRNYLDYVKQHDYWYEDEVLANIKLILNRHLGQPPEEINVDGQIMTPKQFADQVLKIPLDDYVDVMSFKKIPFWTKDVFDVPDNWWKSADYYNVPLDYFYEALKSGIENGYSLVIGGDVSEPGKDGYENLAIVPTFDIPAKYINQDSRELRFYNKTSTDDHGVHLIGYKRYAGQDWFLVKDSSASAWRGEVKGYHFFSGDYIRLKMLTLMVHKDAVRNLLLKFEK